MQRQTVCGENFAELGGVQHENEWPQYTALWDPGRHRDRTRQFGFVDDLLCPILNESCKLMEN